MSTQALLKSGEEPTLDTIFKEPIVRAVMEKDGQSSDHVRALLQRAKEARGRTI